MVVIMPLPIKEFEGFIAWLCIKNIYTKLALVVFAGHRT